MTKFILTLVGCATSTVSDVSTTLPLVQFHSAKNPRALAACAVLALETADYPVNLPTLNSLREFPEEFQIVQQRAENAMVTFVVKIRPDGTGSSLLAYISPVKLGTFGFPFYETYKELYLAKMNGCRQM
jgi:hypothetical protein